MEEISATVDLIVNSIRTKENNRRRKNRRRVLELIDQFEKFDMGSTPETARDLVKILIKDELQNVLTSFAKEFKVAPLLDFISDQGVKKAKGKQKAGKSKNTRQEMGPQTSLKGQERDSLESTSSKEFQPILVEPIKGNSLSCDEFASKINEARENPYSNVWDLPMFDFSRDQIMEYIQGYFGAETSNIQSSILNCDPTFPRMVCTAVKYWNDKQLIVPLLRMIKEVFEKSSFDSEEICHWLVNEKVVLATALLACFLNEEDIFNQVLEIYNGSPFPVKYNKLEDVLLLVSSALTYAKRIETHSLELLNILNLIQHMKDSIHSEFNESDVQKAKCFLVKEGIVDAITEVLSYKDCDLPGLIQGVSIILIDWFKEEVKPVDLLPIFPSALQFLNRMLSQKQISIVDDYIMNTCLHFLQFFIVNIPYEMMVMILNEDSIGLIIHFSRIYSIRQSQVLDILASAATKDKRGVIKDMVKRLKQRPPTYINSKACLFKLNMIVIHISGAMKYDRMKDNATEYSQ
ncbi:uncharacterized protein LOC134817527 [Bolinopsis microptera]|uniref:uncharacterized protein LOC134817527 n=1 Tax=Bolinopsis microptera TaxID=2820187 RepID=UPI00307A318E